MQPAGKEVRNHGRLQRRVFKESEILGRYHHRREPADTPVLAGSILAVEVDDFGRGDAGGLADSGERVTAARVLTEQVVSDTTTERVVLDALLKVITR